jgi:indoleamine 2,3-dioxygenase
MAPHVVPVESRCSNKPSTDLKKFAVTPNGFLPAESPSKLLSDPYYEPWELVVQHLPRLIDEDRIRDAVSKLPVLETDRLLSEAEWRRAYVVLAYIAHAYIWGGERPEEVSEHVFLVAIRKYRAPC